MKIFSEKALHLAIADGEHQQQDFKFRVDDARKIARTLVAFANTGGGRLLIGVKDNGKIAGVRSDEEYHVIESAAQLYTKPEIHFEIQVWHPERKTILEVWVPPSAKRPHKAKTGNGQWLAYVRKGDENLKANGILLQLWRTQKQSVDRELNYTEPEQQLFAFLRKNETITFSRFVKMANIHHKKARNILVKLILWDIIEMKMDRNGVQYAFRPDGEQKR